jgi:predicted HicB family RNase H-like nuclease
MNNTIEYKGYIGTVNYSSDDKCFYGKIATIDDLITFEADNVDDLEKNFKESVDDYLDTCSAIGRNPQKTYKGSFNLRIDAKLHKNLYHLALKENTSLNALIGKTLKYSVDNNLSGKIFSHS